MTREEWIELLKEGVEEFNKYREEHPIGVPYLSGIDLRNTSLRGANLSNMIFARADLRGTDLSEANLRAVFLGEADLQGANLTGADLRGAYLKRADLTEANLQKADLRGVDLSETDVAGANLCEADFFTSDFYHRPNLREANLIGANRWGIVGRPEKISEEDLPILQKIWGWEV